MTDPQAREVATAPVVAADLCDKGLAVSSAAVYAWDAAVADYCSFMAARGSNEMSLRPRRSHRSP